MTEHVYQGKGFTVECAGMHCLRFTENGRNAVVHGEPLILDANELTTSGYVIYSGTAGWEDITQLTSENDKNRIIAAVAEAFTSWGVNLEVA